MNYVALSFLCMVLLSFIPQPANAQQGPFKPGDPMPAMELTIPEIPGHREYLGIAPGTTDAFKLTDVDAEAVLIQIFSMYCPICQKEAPKINDLHAAIEAKGLSDRIKMLGIGAGNSDLEVQVFRDKYAIPFPLISDPEYELHKIFSGVGTPYFVLLQRVQDAADKRYLVKLSHLGGFDYPDVFLERLLVALQQGDSP